MTFGHVVLYLAGFSILIWGGIKNFERGKRVGKGYWVALSLLLIVLIAMTVFVKIES